MLTYGDISRKVLDRFRSPFWLHKNWFVAYDSSGSIFYLPSNCTTLLAEQHIVFYDRITQLIFESNRWQLPYR
ncbi:unnamed protein product [Rotaria sordida]|uniref:Uncharacterized protein n=1 Tax=Rotaria sordida TaxID=392033 RepID=A0A815FZQ7_9BILA|nr:unnamed protein product [Rotaria sordida]CAF3852014.1 unnamed protein product [Rotaria sordida]